MGKNDLATIKEGMSEKSIAVKVLVEVEKIWMNYDLDQNGTLDLDEVSAYLKSRCPHIPEPAVIQTFKQIDTNNDGQIDKEEMFVYVKELMLKHHIKKQ